MINLTPPPWTPQPGDEFLAQTNHTGEQWHRFRLIGTMVSIGDALGPFFQVRRLSAGFVQPYSTITNIRPIQPGFDPDIKLDADGNLIAAGLP